MSEETERRGVIMAICPIGGIVDILVKREDGKVEHLRGDNGATVRALVSVFGDDIVEGHSIVASELYGREIGYDTDDFGMLAYVTE